MKGRSRCTALFLLVALGQPAWGAESPAARPPNLRPELVLQTGHTGPVWSIAVSPDDRYVLTGGHDSAPILWEAESGRQLRSYQGHRGSIWSVAFSPDGQSMASSSLDGTVRIWDVVTGRHQRQIRETLPVALPASVQIPVWMATFHPDGRRLLVTGLLDAQLWDLSTGQLVRRFAEEGQPPKSLAFSPDGRLVLTGGYGTNPPAILWDTETGRKLRAFAGHREAIASVAFSPDGTRVLTGSWDKTAVLWDTASGQTLATFRHRQPIWSAAFSPDGKQVLTASPEDRAAVLWDAQSGQAVERWGLTGRFAGDDQAWTGVFRRIGRQALVGLGANSVAQVALPGGRRIGTLRGDGIVADRVAFSDDGSELYTAQAVVGMKWALSAKAGYRAGRAEFRSMPEVDINRLGAYAWSPDARWLLVVDQAGNAQLADLLGGKTYRHGGMAPQIRMLDCTADGRIAILASNLAPRVQLWDLAGGKVHELGAHPQNVSCLAVSPDGRLALTASSDRSAWVWDLSARKQLYALDLGEEFLNAAVFDPAGQRLLGGTAQGTVLLWNAADGSLLKKFQGANSMLLALGFSRDQRLVLAGTYDNRALAWDAETAALKREFVGHASGVTSVASSPDGRFLGTGSLDGTVRLWDLANGEELVRLVGLVHAGETLPASLRELTRGPGPDWLAVTPEGLFDGSAGGRERVSFRVGNRLQVVPADRFFQDFYRPGLLATIAFGQRPKPTVDLASQQPPRLRIVTPQADTTAAESRLVLQVEARDQGGGVQGPWLLHNGARVLPPGKASRQGEVVTRRFEVSLIEGENRLELRAASADGAWESEPAVRVVRYEQSLERPVLHLVAVGVSRYAEAGLRLRFARADAEAMAAVFQSRGKALYQEIRLQTLLDDAATAAGIRAALRKAAEDARPQDTLLVFLAGHGVLVGQRYYFLPADYKSHADRKQNDDLRAQGLPADELGDFLSLGPALKRMLILDTCASGGAMGLFRVAARDPFALRGEIERLSRSQGIHTIAASAAGEAANEAEELGHGVLSYALLAGLKAVDRGPLERIAIQPASSSQVVDVLEWFSFASGHVPRLTRQISGSEQNVHTAGAGSSFPVLPLLAP